jgi:hypothetical protein
MNEGNKHHHLPYIIKIELRGVPHWFAGLDRKSVSLQ